MKFRFCLVISFVCICHWVSGQVVLRSGPMIGYSTMREVAIWVQTSGKAEVQIRFSESGTENWRWSRKTMTDPDCAFSAELVIDSLLPGKKFNYELMLDGKKAEIPWKLQFQTQALWQYRTDPPNFKMAIGSCFYVNETEFDRPGKPYGGDYQIIPSILQKSPDLMIWLGDNTYTREVDFDSRFGIFHRYSHTRSLPELQPFLGSVHHYATWDDHDYGPNNADNSYFLKETSRDAFNCFWTNPSAGLNGEGITTKFQWADMDVFMLDDRWFRSSDDRTSGARSMIGSVQFQWLIDNLKYSRAPFKFVCIGNQVLNTAKNYETWENLYPEERKILLNTIKEEKIEGVVFLTGDRHHSELSRWKEGDGPVVYDLTVSPLTATANDASAEPNTLRVDGTHCGLRNFAILEFSGPQKAREMKINVCDSNGKEVWTKTLKPGE